MRTRAWITCILTAIIVLGIATAAAAAIEFTGILKPGQTGCHGPIYVNFNTCDLEIKWTPGSCPVRIGMGETNSTALIQWSPILTGGYGRHQFKVTAGKQYYIYVHNHGEDPIEYTVRTL